MDDQTADDGKARNYVILPRIILYDPNVGDSDLRVYAAVWDIAGEGGRGECYATAETIGGRAGGKKVGATQLAIRNLIKGGYLIERPGRISLKTGKPTRLLTIPLHHFNATPILPSRAGAESCSELAQNSAPAPESRHRKTSRAGAESCSEQAQNSAANKEPMNQEPPEQEPVISQSPRESQRETTVGVAQASEAQSPERWEVRKPRGYRAVPQSEDTDPPPVNWIEEANGNFELARLKLASAWFQTLVDQREKVRPADIDRAAGFLARALGDVSNLAYYRGVCWKIFEGSIPHECVSVVMFHCLIGKRDKQIANPGGYFATMLPDEVERHNQVVATNAPSIPPTPAIPQAPSPARTPEKAPGSPATPREGGCPPDGRHPHAEKREAEKLATVPAPVAPAPTPDEVAWMERELRAVGGSDETVAFGRQKLAEGYLPSVIVDVARDAPASRHGRWSIARPKSHGSMAGTLARRRAKGEPVNCEPVPIPERPDLPQVDSDSLETESEHAVYRMAVRAEADKTTAAQILQEFRQRVAEGYPVADVEAAYWSVCGSQWHPQRWSALVKENLAKGKKSGRAARAKANSR